jgi:hypothetical protein
VRNNSDYGIADWCWDKTTENLKLNKYLHHPGIILYFELAWVKIIINIRAM